MFSRLNIELADLTILTDLTITNSRLKSILTNNSQHQAKKETGKNNLNTSSKGIVLSPEGSNEACSKGSSADNKDQTRLLIHRKVGPFNSYTCSAMLLEKLHLPNNAETPDEG